MLEIRLLGPLEARDGERVLEVRRRKQRALLAALALHAGEPVSADRLVEDLWGESAPNTARHALANYVSELRRTLGPDVIRTEPAGYELRVPREHVDAGRFEQLVAGARDLTADERYSAYAEALALVRGEPLEDLAFEPFALAAAPRLHELVLAAREGHAEAALELGKHAEVVVELEPLVAAHPYRERLRARLMLALYRSGRQADALAAYQDARRVLVEELGIDPSEELQELERAILRQDASLRAPERAPSRVSEPASEEVAARPARKTVTVLAVELANVPALAGSLDPEPLRAVLDRYHTTCSAAVERHGGVHRRYDGGGLLAVFGLPATSEDDALRAVRAAVELRDGVGALNDGLLSQHGVFLETRQAVATGQVLVTPQGDEIATGRAVVEARELERDARPGQILIGGSTRELLDASVEVEEIAPERAFRLVELNPDVHGRVLRLDSPLVGRRRQLAALSSAVETAIAERSLHLFTLLGAAGVGKSRLVRELTESVEGVATVLHGRCLPHGDAAALLPVLEALGDAVEPAALSTQPVTAVRTALERIALGRPAVLVLDDLHWAEPSLLDLVDEVAETSRGAPVLLLCLTRPELLESRPSWGGGKPNASSLLLEPLNETESDRLLDNLLGESDLPDSVRDYVIGTADGNPLFVEELLAMLVDQKVLTRDSGRWTTTSAPAIRVPPTIQALIASRIDRLPEGERVVLELASISGKRVFARGAVAELAPEHVRANVDAHLAALVRKELVRPHPADTEHFSFRHQLVRDAAYASLPMATRAELHEHLAEILARTEGDDDALAEYHRDRARRYRVKLGLVDADGRA